MRCHKRYAERMYRRDGLSFLSTKWHSFVVKCCKNRVMYHANLVWMISGFSCQSSMFTHICVITSVWKQDVQDVRLY